MSEKIGKIKTLLLILIVVEVLGLVCLYFLFDLDIKLAALYFIINTLTVYFLVQYFQEDSQNRMFGVSRILGSEAKDAFQFGQIGILTYDENYTITWMSELFADRGINRISKKLTMWLPEVNDLIQGDVEKVQVQIDDRTYEIARKEDARILFFQDVTEQQQLEKAYQEEQVVVGLIHLDNYEESTQYEEEQEIAMINNNIRQPVVEWAKNHGMLLRRLKSDRFLVVLNERIFKQIVDERFSILAQTRKASQQLDVAITLSMGFARGSSDVAQLDEMVNQLLELAQSRGGDQVAIRRQGEDVKYFGGSSEAQEKRSRVRVRIMAHTLRDLIKKSTNVILLGHKEADFDCLGSLMCLSRIVQAYDKPCCIISKSGGMEEKLSGAMNLYKKELEPRHKFVTENEALNQLRDGTLVIMADHHHPSQSNGAQVLEKAKKIAIFDHHRRRTDLDINPILVYIEPSASSACELISEFVPYQTGKVDFISEEATIMLTGMMIDTNRFKVRTGTRTFEAAAMIRRWGADPQEADNLLKDEYSEFETKTKVLKFCEKRDNGIVISAVTDNEILSRSMLSQVADSILTIKGVEAAFVIAKISDSQTAISARSRGRINVQVIMERMHGGGHLSAAALQRENTKVEDLRTELITTLDEVMKEE